MFPPRIADADSGIVDRKNKKQKRKSRVALLGLGAGVLRRLPRLLQDADTLVLQHGTRSRQSELLLSRFSPDFVLCGRKAWNRSSPGGLSRGKPELTPRDKQLLLTLYRGLRNDEIARHLGVSTRTVKGYLTRLFVMFDVTNRTELVGSAIDLGLLDVARQASRAAA